MRFAKESVPESADFNGLTPAFMQWPKGMDASTLLEGLPGGLCHCPHWGYALKGVMLVKYSDGSAEEIRGGDVYYLPAGHTALIKDDFASVEFNPKREFREVMAHVAKKMQGK